jgi:hypothetical protein
MDTLDVSNAVLKFIAERIGPSLCGFAWREGSDAGNGTGTLIVTEGRSFVITCAHVATPFLACRGERALLFTKRPTVAPSALKAVHMDTEQDLAVIEVLTPLEAPGLSPALLDRSFRLSREVAEHTDAAFCGLPWEFSLPHERPWFFTPLVFLTGFAGPYDPTVLSCGYPRGRGQVSNISELPRPHGISGSLLWTVPNPTRTPGPVWSLESMRAVGVITSFLPQSQRLEAVPLTSLPVLATPAT